MAGEKEPMREIQKFEHLKNEKKNFLDETNKKAFFLIFKRYLQITKSRRQSLIIAGFNYKKGRNLLS